MTNHDWEIMKGLEPAEAEEVEALGTRQLLSEGSVLFELGADADHLFLVVRGRANLSLPVQLGGQPQDMLVEERGPGQVLGWSALIPPHQFTLKATAPLEAEFLAFPREALLSHLTEKPKVGHLVMRNLAATVGQRLQTLQVMWLREVQRLLERQSG